MYTEVYILSSQYDQLRRILWAAAHRVRDLNGTDAGRALRGGTCVSAWILRRTGLLLPLAARAALRYVRTADEGQTVTVRTVSRAQYPPECVEPVVTKLSTRQIRDVAERETH